MARRTDFDEIAPRLARNCRHVLSKMYPGVVRFSGGYGYVADIQGSKVGDSVVFNLDDGRWKDWDPSSGCPSGRLQNAIMLRYGFANWTETFAKARDLLNMPKAPEDDIPVERNRKRDDGDTNRLVGMLWDEAIDISGTPAGDYLKSRGILSRPGRFRFHRNQKHPPTNKYYSALVGLATDVADKKVALHRVFLFNDGTRIDSQIDTEPKASLGPTMGAAIRLGPAAPTIIVAESMEEGVTVLDAQAGPPVWCATSASQMQRMVFPDVVKRVIVAANNDDAGRAGIDGMREFNKEKGIEIDPLYALSKDWNEDLSIHGLATIRQRLLAFIATGG